MNERRRWKRYTIAYPIEYKGVYTSQPLTLIDVSREGIAFTTGEKLNKDDKIDVHIYMKKKMFNLQALVVHAMSHKDGYRLIGAKLIDAPDDFVEGLEREIGEIEAFHRQTNLYQNKKLTLKTASMEYLKKTFLS